MSELSAAARDAIAAWSHAGKQRVEAIIAGYPEQRSAVMPLLYLAMLEHEYVSDDAIREVAALTELTAAQVQSVASFYSMYKREPVGKYLVSVCTSISCFLRGADEVLAAVEDASGVPDGETGGEELFSVEHVECNGACGGAPVVLVDYEMVEGVTPDKARELVKWLRDGQPGVVNAEEMQQLFGGIRSFDWAVKETEGAFVPVPAFGPYGSAREGS